MDLKDIGRKDKECTHVAQDRGRYQAFVKAVMNHRVV
jgi:hypothetical protein